VGTLDEFKYHFSLIMQKLPVTFASYQVVNHDSSLGVILCHPWGPLGGNMDNYIILYLAHFFKKLRITTLRLNFAGSQIGRGNYQVKQVIEAANVLLSGDYDCPCNREEEGNDVSIMPPSCLLLVGYSYGSLITASATASISHCIGCISISPPIGVMRFLLMFNHKYHAKQAKKRLDLPRLCIMGDKDNFTSISTIEKELLSYPKESTTLEIIKDVDHFFVGQTKMLVEPIENWLLKTYIHADNGHIKDLALLSNKVLQLRKTCC